MTVKEINYEYRMPKLIVNLLTTLMFAAFTAYQVYLYFEIEEQRLGRLFGIGIFVCLFLASAFSLIRFDWARVIFRVLLIAGLIAYFLLKLLSINTIFSKLDFSNIPSVLNCAIFIFAELALLILVVYYLALRPNIYLRVKRKPTVILMSVVIALFVSCLVMECILILGFGMNIELKLRYTLISRFFYCFAFVGLAVGFMIPVSLPGNMIKEIEDKKMQEFAPGEVDDDFIF